MDANRGQAGRRLWWLAADEATARRWAGDWLASVPGGLWLGEGAPAAVDSLPLAQARQRLGGEHPALVIDAFGGFDPEAFGAVAGTLRAGGVLLLLTPPAAEWPTRPDPQLARFALHPYRVEQLSGHFIARLTRLLGASVAVERFDGREALPPAPPLPAAVAHAGPFRSDDQQAAVAAIEALAHGHRHRPLVLTSDRGRGKSAALGIAAARLLQAGPRQIRVTAPRRSAVEALFRHAQALLPGAEVSDGELAFNGGRLAFSAPDALLHERPAAELLLVDEAAAIPAALLQRMLGHYARIVFATTVHGYEGTGRGFALRFKKTLDARTPGWHELKLSQPIRWPADDPLEVLVNRLLLLDAEPAADSALSLPGETALEWWQGEALAADEALLGELFGLLVQAHYRTSPNDLRQLLDGPGLSLALLRRHGHVAAVVLVVEEGGLDTELACAVYRGERRPRGHLLPQSLAVHAGFAEASLLRGLRVMRIAVHPALRRQGLGLQLLAAVEERARERGLDFVGTAFGGEPGLLAFWRRSGWPLARIGLSREASSGSYPLLLLHGLSPAAIALEEEAQRRLRHALPLLLADPLREMGTAMAEALAEVVGEGPVEVGLTLRDWGDLASFAHAGRDYGHCLGAIHKLLQRALDDGQLERLAPAARELLIGRVWQHRDWSELAREHALPGRRGVQQALRQAVASLLAGYPQAVTWEE